MMKREDSHGKRLSKHFRNCYPVVFYIHRDALNLRLPLPVPVLALIADNVMHEISMQYIKS